MLWCLFSGICVPTPRIPPPVSTLRPDTPPFVVDFIQRCCALTPTDRPTAAEIPTITAQWDMRLTEDLEKSAAAKHKHQEDRAIIAEQRLQKALQEASSHKDRADEADRLAVELRTTEGHLRSAITAKEREIAELQVRPSEFYNVILRFLPLLLVICRLSYAVLAVR